MMSLVSPGSCIVGNIECLPGCCCCCCCIVHFNLFAIPFQLLLSVPKFCNQETEWERVSEWVVFFFSSTWASDHEGSLPVLTCLHWLHRPSLLDSMWTVMFWSRLWISTILRWIRQKCASFTTPDLHTCPGVALSFSPSPPFIFLSLSLSLSLCLFVRWGLEGSLSSAAVFFFLTAGPAQPVNVS